MDTKYNVSVDVRRKSLDINLEISYDINSAFNSLLTSFTRSLLPFDALVPSWGEFAPYTQNQKKNNDAADKPREKS